MNKAILLFLFFAFTLGICAQTEVKNADTPKIKIANTNITNKPFQSWGVGIDIGTDGGGINVITNLSPHFIARAGFDYFGFSNKPDDMNLDVETDDGNDVSAKINTLKVNLSNAKLLVDYYPFRNGIFSLTGGLYVGQSKITMKGHADQKFNLDDIVIQPDANGYFDASLVLGNSVKPYFGIGLGRTLAKKRIGFRFELGAIYQGHYKIKSDYMTSESVSEANNAIEDELPKSVLDFWPVLNFNLSYRFK